MKKHGGVCRVFQQDNAPPHGKGNPDSKTHMYLKKMGIRTMKWPANSPDLSPIEFVWRWIKGKIAGEILRTKEEIVARYRYWWDKFPLETYRKLTAKLPEMMKVLSKTRGSAQFK